MTHPWKTWDSHWAFRKQSLRFLPEIESKMWPIWKDRKSSSPSAPAKSIRLQRQEKKITVVDLEDDGNISSNQKTALPQRQQQLKQPIISTKKKK